MKRDAAMTVCEVLSGVQLHRRLPGTIAGLNVAGLEYDSRRIERDFLFFAFPGAREDGRRFAGEAMAKGACAVVSELPVPEDLDAGFQDRWIEVAHGRQALAIAAGNFLRHPDQRVCFTGVTGTNGKTTTAHLIDAILRAAEAVTGMIGTIENRVAGETRPAVNTTPESLDVLRLAVEVERLGGKYLTMEVSSHALALARVYGLQFHTAVFTNLTRDHLDFHHTMDAYAAAKRLLFVPNVPDNAATAVAGPRWAILNADDPASKNMTPGGDSRVLWYGLSKSAELRAENIRSGFDGLHFEMVYQGQRQSMASPLVGNFNVSNILAAAGAALSYGFELAAIARGIAASPPVPGRFERVDCGQPFLVVVDYAHTDDALRNAIQVARELATAKKQHGNQSSHGARVITLFGCGGDRDRTKRPLMGTTAAELSDFVVLTSDNPRSEDPLDIINDVMVGLGRFDTPHITEPDRAKAIRRAIEEARPGDVVLLAGKGHETYQILKDRTIDFDDRETARQVLLASGYGRS